MNEIDKSISRTILVVGKIKVTLVVILNEVGTPQKPARRKIWVSKREVEHTVVRSIGLDYFPFVTILNADSPIDDFRKSMVVMTMKNQHRVVKAFRKMLRVLYQEDIFFMDGNTIKRYELQEDWIVRCNTGKDIFVMAPTVVVDINDGKSYEGVQLSINRDEIYAELTLDEFEAMVHILEKIDLFVYSQELLNFYYGIKTKVEVEENPYAWTKRRTPSTSLFQQEPTRTNEERVEGTARVKETDIMDNIPGENV